MGREHDWRRGAQKAKARSSEDCREAGWQDDAPGAVASASMNSGPNARIAFIPIALFLGLLLPLPTALAEVNIINTNLDYSDTDFTGDGDTGTYSNNVLNISGSTVGAGIGIFGGGSATVAVSANNNHLTITDSEVGAGFPPSAGSSSVANFMVTGGYATYINLSPSLADEVRDNVVTVNNSTVYGAVYGGYVEGYSDGRLGVVGTAIATGNTVTISGGTLVAGNLWIDSRTGEMYARGDGDVVGGYAKVRGDFNNASMATATENSVTITGGTVNSDVDGGYAFTSVNGTATATHNGVTISGGTIDGGVCGGCAATTGSDYFDNNWNLVSPTGTATATGNTVNISGGTVNGDVTGGMTSVWADEDGTFTATANTVTISGGTVNGNVYGGYSFLDYSTGTASASATNNTVTISGSPLFGAGTNLYGGFVDAWDAATQTYIPAPGMDARTGNTLNLHAPIIVASAQNFENWNFYLPASMGNGGTMLTVTGTADIGPNAKVNVGIDGASSPLRAGDTVKLIDAGTLTGSLANTTANGQGMQGVTLLYDFDLTSNDKQLLATVTSADLGTNPGTNPGTGGASLNPQAKALPEGVVAGAALLLQGADLTAGQGISEAVGAAKEAGSGSVNGHTSGTGLGGFGVISGGWSRYDTGSHVDMSSVSLLAGLAHLTETRPGKLTVGAFFEYGNGSYDTYNSFTNAASIHGDGDMYHLGGGLLGRMDLADGKAGHAYAEASVRAGGVHNDYNGGNLRDAWGRSAQYDSSTAYYGAHAGAGYILSLTGQAGLDLYGKYFWTHENGDSFRLSTGDPVDFDAVDSHRLRFGGRFNYAVNDLISPYIGAAWEHEFDGKARATTNGYAIDAPSLSGDTGIGELGLAIKASKTLALSIDLGVQGYVGAREGVIASGQIRFDF